MAEEPTSTEEIETDEVEVLEEFDKDRALATIKAQRAAEKALKAELQEARKSADELAAIKQAQEDADKTALDKLADRDSRIAQLEKQISETAVKADFVAKAAGPDRAYLDLDLAFLAAEKQGLLGSYDPKTGTVGDHNFDKLEELYPALRGEDNPWSSNSGDAGVRGKTGKTGTPGSAFNAAVRTAVRR